MNAAASKAKGDALLAQAKKRLSSWSFFNSSKQEDAAELLDKAANNYKLAKAWNEAAEVYQELAGIHEKLGSQHDAATAYVEASKALMKTNAPECVTVLQKAVDLYTDMGRLNQAARYIRDIAEQMEKQESGEASIEFYRKAADLFAAEDSTSEANKCRLKIAQYVAISGEYQQAVEIFEDISKQAAEHNLLKFSAKGYLLNAGICRMCFADIDSLSAMLDRYQEIDLTFSNSRECNLLESIITALEAGDDTTFSEVVAHYDALSKLDEWRTSILWNVKNRVVARKKGEEDEEDDLT